VQEPGERDHKHGALLKIEHAGWARACSPRVIVGVVEMTNAQLRDVIIGTHHREAHP
jgi:hypothetical protein